MEHWLRLAMRYAPIAAIIPVLGFIVVYQAKGKWWKTPIGRYMMGSMIGWCFVIGITILFTFFRTLPGAIWIGASAWVVIITIKTWSFIVIFRSMVMKNYQEQKEIRDQDARSADSVPQ